MSDVQGRHPPKPSTSEKIHFWLGGSLPMEFNAWAQERIRSRWFPLRRLIPVVAGVVTFLAGLLYEGTSLFHSLRIVAPGILLGLAWAFLFRNRIRRRQLRRYQISTPHDGSA
jgi:hypothetical protein